MSVNVRGLERNATPRILLIGRSRLVLEAVMQELRALAFHVEGTTDPDEVAGAFDAADYDLAAIGGGVATETPANLKQDFARRNPEIRLLDSLAPVAVSQILAALNGEHAGPSIDLDAYCARIGYDGPRTPCLETLRALQSLHPDAVTFEAIDVLLGRGVDLAPEAVDAKLIGARRGGYCFEQNSLFKRALEAMGFHVEGLAARVRWNAPAGTPIRPHTHMALKVTIDRTPWLADAGFGGCVVTTPLRMDAAEPQATRHEQFRVFPFATSLLVQVQRDDAWLPLYELSQEPRYDADYELANWFTATHPSSRFRNELIVARTTAEARYGLLNNRFTVRRPDGRSERQELDADGIERVLTEIFRLPVAADDIERLTRIGVTG